MGRATFEPEPKILRRRAETPFSLLQRELGTLGEVRPPSDAEEPILTPMVRAWLHQWMTEIRMPDELAAVGLKARSTAMLHGPPGCGKTTLAHHLSARLGLPLVLVGPESILAKYLGEAEQNIAKLFRVLSNADTPCVLFMDELEALGRRRTGSDNGGGAENARQNMLTVLLRKVEEYEGYLIGSTNRPDDLDLALWRRFHAQLAIDLPGGNERYAILCKYLAPFVLRDTDLDLLVDLTDGASPALLRGVMEGVKRALVVFPRINRLVDDAAVVFGSVVAGVQPPPEVESPRLWTRQGLASLATMAWPPTRADAG